MNKTYGEKELREFARDILIDTGSSTSEANLQYVTYKLAEITDYVINLSVESLIEGGFLIDTGLRDEIDNEQ